MCQASIRLCRRLAFIRPALCRPSGSVRYIVSELGMVLRHNKSNCTTSYCNLRITVLTSVSPVVCDVKAEEWPYCSLGFTPRSLACSVPHGGKKNRHCQLCSLSLCSRAFSLMVTATKPALFSSCRFDFSSSG